jgi:hypothetical protein
MNINPRCRIICCVALILLSLALFIGLASINLCLSAPKAGEKPLRLRWYFVSKNRIVSGSTIAAEDVEKRLRRLPEDKVFVSNPRMLLGRYALQDIDKETVLNADAFSSKPDISVPPGGAVVLVQVKSGQATGIRPPVTLAFARKDFLYPPMKRLYPGQAPSGFRLLSVAPSPHDPAVSILVVQIPKHMLSYAKELSSEIWQPIVVSSAPGKM